MNKQAEGFLDPAVARPDPAESAAGIPAPHESAHLHVAGEAPYTDDIAELAGTLGGNVANGSPIGDSMPALTALQASVVLAGVRGTRTLPLEDFYLGYQKKDLGADEIVAAIEVPKRRPNLRYRCYKVSKRYDSDISAVCAAFAIWLDGDRVEQCRIAFGGMAATPKRAINAEAALDGALWNEKHASEAGAALAADFQPLSDLRASADYRLRVAQNLLRRFHLETRADAPLAPHQVSVFATQ